VARAAASPAARPRTPSPAVTAEPPADDVLLEPDALASWLRVDARWITDAITRGLPVFGHRTDGLPLFVAGDVRAWLRRPSVDDDAT